MPEYIDRETAIKKLKLARDYCISWNNSLSAIGLCEAIDIIRSILPEKVTPVVHGRWVFEHATGERSYYYAHCSRCGCRELFSAGDARKPDCCMCGSKMDKEDK